MQSAYSAHPERLHAPDNFQRRITQVGGLNRYRKPRFKLAWAQAETTRQGGEFPYDGDSETMFVGYREVYKGDGLPHWMLMQWVDAGMSIEMPHIQPQSAEWFYQENRCAKTGLQILGEYPYHGSYQIALPLVAKIFDKGQLYIEAFPLSTEIVEMMVPIIKASLELSLECKMRFMKECEEKDDIEFGKRVDDIYHGVKRKASLASTSWLEDKMRSMERHFNVGLVTMMARNRRFQAQNQLRRPN
jgi:hypothetical protein